MNITKALLIKHLQDMGISKGDVVLFHSSLKSIGHVEPEPKAVIEAFLEVLGPKGTLVVPTLIPAYQGLRSIYDVAHSPSEMGLLTEIVRTWPGALRSNQSTHSVAAIGKLADDITRDHCQRAWGPNTPWGENAVGFDSPWDRLAKHNAWIVMIGVDYDRCTLLHHAQVHYLAKHENKTAETPWPHFDFRKMGERLATQGVIKQAKLGEAACNIGRAQDILKNTLTMLDSKPKEIFTDSNMLDWQDTCALIEEQGHCKAAGFKAEITLPKSKQIVARPLHIRGVIIDHPQDGRVAFILWDTLNFHEKEGAVIRDRVAKVLNITREKVQLTASHTHSGHVKSVYVNQDYVNHVAELAAQSAADALTKLEPVRAGWTSISTAGICRNRSVYLKDGRAYTERWSIPSTWHIPAEDILKRGPADDELRVLMLERLDRSCLAIISNISCHNTAALTDNRISDDFFGVAMELVENIQDSECTVLITPGSIGDQDPTGSIKLGAKRDQAYANNLGKRLAGYMLSAIENIEVRDIFSLRVNSETMKINIRDDWYDLVKNFTHPEIKQCIKDKTVSAEITLVAIGEFAMLFTPGEIFTTSAHDIQKHATYQCTSIVSLSNGTVFYIPEKSAYGYDIYGTLPDYPAMVKPGTDVALCETAYRVMRQKK